MIHGLLHLFTACWHPLGMAEAVARQMRDGLAAPTYGYRCCKCPRRRYEAIDKTLKRRRR